MSCGVPSLGQVQDDLAHVLVGLHVGMGLLDFSHWVDSVHNRLESLGALHGEVRQNLLRESLYQRLFVLR